MIFAFGKFRFFNDRIVTGWCMHRRRRLNSLLLSCSGFTIRRLIGGGGGLVSGGLGLGGPEGGGFFSVRIRRGTRFVNTRSVDPLPALICLRAISFVRFVNTRCNIFIGSRFFRCKVLECWYIPYLAAGVREDAVQRVRNWSLPHLRYRRQLVRLK